MPYFGDRSYEQLPGGAAVQADFEGESLLYLSGSVVSPFMAVRLGVALLSVHLAQ